MKIEEIKAVIVPILTRHGIKRAGIFGSVAKGNATSQSDIDILVSFAETIDLFTLVRMHRELEELLHRKVDIVTEKSLHPSFKPYVERDLQIIAEAA